MDRHITHQWIRVDVHTYCLYKLHRPLHEPCIVGTIEKVCTRHSLPSNKSYWLADGKRFDNSLGARDYIERKNGIDASNIYNEREVW